MTGPGNLLDFPQLHKVLGAIVNTGRSFPYVKDFINKEYKERIIPVF